MGIDYSRLPTNENGDPEYGSVLLTIDTRIPDRGNHVIDKFVASTQSPEETLDNLFGYYKEEYIREMDSTLEALGKGYNTLSAYIYVTAAGIIQVVMSSSTFGFIVGDENFGKGSSLVAMEKFKGVIGGILDNSQAQQGEIAPVHCITFNLRKVSEEELAAEASADATAKARAFLGSLSEEEVQQAASIAQKMQTSAEISNEE